MVRTNEESQFGMTAVLCYEQNCSV